MSPPEIVRAAWPLAVGKKIARHTRAVSVQQDRLIVEVADAIWQQQLMTLRAQIVASLRKTSGLDLISDIEFRVAVPRREPQRAEAARTAMDEADGIRDPGLRRVYKLSRQRSLLA